MGPLWCERGRYNGAKGAREQSVGPQSRELLTSLTRFTMIQDSLKICTVCASNNNRSMESHKQLQDAGYNVKSFGTGSAVKLPGPTIDRPNVYPFGTPYEDIYQDLTTQEYHKMYEANGLVSMVNRNRFVKKAPEKWHTNAYAGKFDLVITCEERCFDSVIDDLMYRMTKDDDVKQPVHVINVDIKDDNENAKIGGKGILKLVNMIHESNRKEKERRNALNEDVGFILLEDHIMQVLTEWQKEHTHLPTLYSMTYY